MDEKQIAWAAGLFEGEGCCLMDSPNKNNPGHRRAKVRLVMNDGDVVKRFHEVVGMGNLRGPIKWSSKTPKLMYKVEIARWLDLIKLYEMFKPYLGERRLAWFEEAIETCKPKFVVRKPEELPDDCGYCSPGEVTVKGYIRHRKEGTEVCKGCYAAYILYHRRRRDHRTVLDSS